MECLPLFIKQQYCEKKINKNYSSRQSQQKQNHYYYENLKPSRKQKPIACSISTLVQITFSKCDLIYIVTISIVIF